MQVCQASAPYYCHPLVNPVHVHTISKTTTVQVSGIEYWKFKIFGRVWAARHVRLLRVGLLDAEESGGMLVS